MTKELREELREIEHGIFVLARKAQRKHQETADINPRELEPRIWRRLGDQLEMWGGQIMEIAEKAERSYAIARSQTVLSQAKPLNLSRCDKCHEKVEHDLIAVNADDFPVSFYGGKIVRSVCKSCCR